MSPWRSVPSLLLLVGLVAAGCAEPGHLDGDCTVRVGFGGVTYRAHNELNQDVPTGEALGAGDLLECDSSVVGETEVFAVVGVDTSVAVAQEEGRQMSVYVAEGLSPSEWPTLLRNPRP